MPDLKETIARLRELIEECKRLEPYDSAESIRLHRAFAAFNATTLEAMPQLLDAAEECEKLRADKERLLSVLRRCAAMNPANYGEVSDAKDAARQALKEKADA